MNITLLLLCLFEECSVIFEHKIELQVSHFTVVMLNRSCCILFEAITLGQTSEQTPMEQREETVRKSAPSPTQMSSSTNNREDDDSSHCLRKYMKIICMHHGNMVHYHHRWNRSTFLRTGAGTGLNKSDRTGPAGLPV